MLYTNSLLFILFITISIIDATLVNYSLHASRYTPNPTVDGFSKTQLAFNNQFPGPTLMANFGDTMTIIVSNGFNEPLSVHWHGVHQRGTITSDGAPMFTQCHIHPNCSRSYTFTVQQTGTYWYHAHSAIQYGDGLYGALIFYDNNPPLYNYVNDTLVLLGDRYHDNFTSLLAEFKVSTTGAEPVPDNVIINGVGQGYCGTQCDYSLFVVSNSGPTLFRFINTAIFAPITVSIDGHYFIVVEVDGSPVIEPGLTVDSINVGRANTSINQIRLNVGQRYGVLVFPPSNNDSNSYWMRATMDTDAFDSAPPITSVLGIVSVPCRNCFRVTDLKTLPTPLRSSTTTPLPTPTRTETILLEMGPNSQGYNRPFLNGTTCEAPLSTYYLALLQAGKYPSMKFPCFNLTIDNGTVVRIIFNNHDDGEHPMHLHGLKFWVLEEAAPDAGDFNTSTANLDLLTPLLRDVATVNPNSYLVIQFNADNPGLWLLHCHINWHMSVGFIGVLTIGVPELLEEVGTTNGLIHCH